MNSDYQIPVQESNSEELFISVEEIHNANDELANKYDGSEGDGGDDNPDSSEG